MASGIRRMEVGNITQGKLRGQALVNALGNALTSTNTKTQNKAHTKKVKSMMRKAK